MAHGRQRRDPGADLASRDPLQKCGIYQFTADGSWRELRLEVLGRDEEKKRGRRPRLEDAPVGDRSHGKAMGPKVKRQCLEHYTRNASPSVFPFDIQMAQVLLEFRCVVACVLCFGTALSTCLVGPDNPISGVTLPVVGDRLSQTLRVRAKIWCSHRLVCTVMDMGDCH